MAAGILSPGHRGSQHVPPMMTKTVLDVRGGPAPYNGPAQVKSEAYEAGWDETFGDWEKIDGRWQRKLFRGV